MFKLYKTLPLVSSIFINIYSIKIEVITYLMCDFLVWSLFKKVITLNRSIIYSTIYLFYANIKKLNQLKPITSQYFRDFVIYKKKI